VKGVLSTLSDCEAENLVKFLLAAAKGKEHLKPELQAEMLSRVGNALKPELDSLCPADIMKIVLAISSHGASPLIEATSKVVVSRIVEFSQTQMLFITQGLLPSLGRSHPSALEVFKYWPGAFTKSRPNDKLSADQIVKLALATAPAFDVGENGPPKEVKRFMPHLGAQLITYAKDVSDDNRNLLIEQLHGQKGSLRFLPQAKDLLRILEKQEKLHKRSRSPSRDIDEDDVIGGAGTHKKRSKKAQNPGLSFQPTPINVPTTKRAKKRARKSA